MGKPKLVKFAALKDMSNVFEMETKMKGRWRDSYFGNKGEIVLELACGKGEYTLGLASEFPLKNYIGVDIKGNRIWSAATRGKAKGLDNIAFIRTQIDHIEDYFERGEVDEIWITFPDPYLKPSKWKKRLTSPRFLNRYRKILKPGGLIHLKTDNDVLYEFTKAVIEEGGHQIVHDHRDIYADEVTHLTHDIVTYYEEMHIRNRLSIKYICFRLSSEQ